MSDINSIYITCRYSNDGSGMHIARAIKQQLELIGYKERVYFDDIGNDSIEQRAFDVIAKAKVFICVLTADSMDKCASPIDRLRMEIIQAKHCGLKMIFINPNGDFKDNYPAGFPNELAFVKSLHHITVHMDSSFERDVAGIAEMEIAPVFMHGFSKDLVGYISLALVIICIIISVNTHWWVGLLLFLGASYIMSKLHII